MAVSQKIIKFLEANKVKYETIEHRKVFTAFDKSQTLRVLPKIVGKTLLVKLDRNPALVLIAADKNLDKQRLKKTVMAREVDFIKEAWMKKNLKGIKIGAIPPFGSIFKMLTFIDRGLVRNPKIIVNSGDYVFSIKISPAVIKKIIPDSIIGNFSKPR